MVSNSVITYKEGKTVYVSESGLYNLTVRSKLPAAKSFKKWVTSEMPKVKEMWKRRDECNKHLAEKD